MTQKPRILIAINSLVSTVQTAYSNHIQFFYRLGRDPLYQNWDFVLFNPARMSIDRMRNMAARTALENDCQYLLFLDDDVLVPIDGLQKLLSAAADIASGHVIVRGYPFENMFFKYNKEQTQLPHMKEEDLPPGDIFDVDAVGFSFTLIDVNLLKKLPSPFFVTGLTNTEDIYFCLKAKHYFPETTIKVNQTITCAHILWSEMINKDNRDAYKTYFLSVNPSIGEEEENKKQAQEDRGQIYYDSIISQLDKKDELALDESFETEETIG